jgi:hypothetical protein
MWTVAELASFLGVPRKLAKSTLLSVDGEHGGKLIERRGKAIVVHVATLRRLAPEMFLHLETEQCRLDALEDAVQQLARRFHFLRQQVEATTREIAKLATASPAR